MVSLQEETGLDETTATAEANALPSRLLPASKEDIRVAMRQAYKEANHPPNVNDVVKPVQSILKEKQRYGGKPTIQKVANEDEFKNQRYPPGWRKERKRRPLLKSNG
jgi:hypothetical protein